jgi:transcriptional regulator with XRE-family HTH domain
VLNNLADIRKAHKLTQAELGQIVGVSQRAIASYESGERKPSPKIMNRLMAELQITVDVAWKMLYGDDDAR